MREVRIDCWCDVCHATAKQVAGETIEITLGARSQPRELDLCMSHREQLIEPLAVVLGSFGSVVAASSKSSKATRKRPASQVVAESSASGVRHGMRPEGPRDWLCLWCSLDYASSSGYLRHLLSHGAPVASLVEIFGHDCPLCGDTFGMLGGHLTRSHGGVNVARAFVEAAIGGDQFGVVEPVHKSLSEDVTRTFDDLKRLE
jgi:hypothetical protein